MDTDEALFERLALGELSAFDRLYARYERPLFGFVRGRLGDAQEAEDVLHEAFMSVLRERGRRTEVRSFRAWLYQVAHHLCLNRIRSRKRRDRLVESAAQEIPTSAAEPPEVSLDSRQRAAALERAVARLSEPLAEVYRLRASGMSYEEVAGVTGVPLGTVKSRMHELVRRLREEMHR